MDKFISVFLILAIGLLTTFLHDGFMYGYNWERVIEACHRHQELSDMLGGKHQTSATYKECTETIETWNNRWLKH
jgi:hypothetical protein